MTFYCSQENKYLHLILLLKKITTKTKPNIMHFHKTTPIGHIAYI